MLVASGIALATMAAVATLIGTFSRTVTTSQSIVDMTSRMRAAGNRLQLDLSGVTAPLRPPLDGDAAVGYFELLEGPASDQVLLDGTTAITGTHSMLGDTDDALLFTTRSAAEPFHGRYGNGQIESPLAEVAWFCRSGTYQPIEGLTLHTLYRRQLLVVGYIGSGSFAANNANQIVGTLPQAYETFDVSMRAIGTQLVPNSLADLTIRENRFLHATGTAAFDRFLSGATFESIPGGGARADQDVVLTNVIGFDVRVYDPLTQPRLSGTNATAMTVVYPHEQNYARLAGASAPFVGGFIDLGCLGAAGTTPLTLLSNTSSRLGLLLPTGTVSLTGTGAFRLYDTWSLQWESNGVNDDATAAIDDATDGVDNNGNGIPDDAAELERPPPYAVPLRAVEIRIRCYDPLSRTARQITIRRTFTN